MGYYCDDDKNRIHELFIEMKLGHVSHVSFLAEVYRIIDENEKLKRRIFGLETTVRNFQEKEAHRYNGMSWRYD